MAIDEGRGDAGRLLNHYRIVSRLSTSDTGEVFLARDTLLDRAVALRVLPPETTGEAARAFLHKARAASALAHPNVAEIYAISEDAGVRFLAMEYVEGETLAARIAGRPLDLDEIVATTINVAQALAAAHAKGITHGGLQSGYIRITPEGQVKIFDFGVSWLRRAAPTTDSEDAHSDVVAVGSVLQQMLAPIPSDSDKDAGSKSGRRAELERIALRCLETDPERRYRSVSELLAELGPLRPSEGRNWSLPQWAVGALLLAALTIVAVTTISSHGPGGRIDSVAVLPFLSADPAIGYLSEGITEQLIRGFAFIPGLKVIAYETTSKYKGRPVDARKIGEELGVRAVSTGRVTQQGDHLTVEAALMDTRDGSELWRRNYTGVIAEVQAMEVAIAREITARLRPRPSSAQLDRITRRYAGSPEAHALYLRGRELFNRGDPESIRASIVEYQRAVALEPRYALGYAGLAESYTYLAHSGVAAPKDVLPPAGVAARRAIELDSELAEAHAALGIVRLYWEWNWSGADKELRTALQLSPGNAHIRHLLAHYLEASGKMIDAIVEMRRAAELDPLSLIISLDLLRELKATRQYDVALRQWRSLLKIEPNDPYAHLVMADLHRRMGKDAEAQAEFALAGPAASRTPFGQALIGIAHAAFGRKAEARKCLDELERLSRSGYVSPVFPAAVRFHLGDRAGGYAALDEAYEARATELTSITRELLLPDLRTEPRFQALMTRIGLPKR